FSLFFYSLYWYRDLHSFPTRRSSDLCSEVSNCVVVYVNDVTGGTIAGDQIICGDNPAAFTQVTASTGSGALSYQWQSAPTPTGRSEEHTSELQSRENLVCRLLLEKKN